MAMNRIRLSSSVSKSTLFTSTSRIGSSRTTRLPFATTSSHSPFISSNFHNNNNIDSNTSRLFSVLDSSSSSTSSTTNTENQYTPIDPKKLAQLMPEYDPTTGQKFTTYEKCVRRLYLTNLFHPVKLGLQNMQELHSALGNPMDATPTNPISVIHIAGTNGKGSVAFKLAKIFELAGYNVGLFVSPHIASFRERMQVNSTPITETEVEDLLPRIFDICEEKEIPATFFEVTTALGFAFFQKRNVDVVVLETGLGGRLDATNVVSNPKISVITSIGLEHTRILGDTVELIGREKAGIMKPNAPVLVGPNVPHDVMKECADEKGTDGYWTCQDVLGDEIDDNPERVVVNGIEFDDYDIQNGMIAKAAIKILEQKNDMPNVKFPMEESIIEKGITHRPPCRFEERTVQVGNDSNSNNKKDSVIVIFDVAHNPPAMDHLVCKLQATYPNKEKRIVVGFSADKDLAQCGRSLLSIVHKDPSKLHVVEAAHPRAAKLEDILNAEPQLRESNFDVEDRSITAQVKSALAMAQEKDEILVVCGSVFLMAEAREAIGIEEPRDSEYIAEVAGANLRHGQEFFANSDPEKDDKNAA